MTASNSGSSAVNSSVTEDKKKLEIWLKPWPTIIELIDAFITKLKRRQISGSYKVAKETTELLRCLLGSTRWTTAKQIIEKIRMLGRVLAPAQPRELTIGNIIRRVLYIIREEYVNRIKTIPMDSVKVETGGLDTSFVGSSLQQSLSLQTILAPSAITDYSVPIKDLKQSIMEGISELIEEIENLTESLAEQSLEYIHANEVILTIGFSYSVLEFLKAAAKKRQFNVFVAEAAPSFEGQKMARELALSGISTTLINDSAIFAMMQRVNKVVIPTVAVMANGGLIASSGTHMVALAAKRGNIPVVCISGMYKVRNMSKNLFDGQKLIGFKLCHMYAHDQDTCNDIISPASLLEYSECRDYSDNVNVVNPSHDYVPPELVDLFITNIGGHQPSYIYRLLAEYYSPEDYDLDHENSLVTS